MFGVCHGNASAILLAPTITTVHQMILHFNYVAKSKWYAVKFVYVSLPALLLL